MTIETIEREFHDKVSGKIRARTLSRFLFEDGDHLAILRKERFRWVLSDEAPHLTDTRRICNETRANVLDFPRRQGR